ncbi:hypothetical protein [Agromyces laixinhei]|uniref:hypothetical protein n=1 Tax=Agromyces laixinhei TaxID=2585717 RepID=UPI0012EE05B6|nr:hypothetical protein [Agromyces laixinhei]
MKFPELCQKLILEVGRADVCCAAYPHLGTRGSTVLRVRDGIFDVGDVDRGEWFSSGQFTTEDEACDYLYKDKTRVRPAPRVVETPEERARSRAITDDTTARLKETFRRRDV